MNGLTPSRLVKTSAAVALLTLLAVAAWLPTACRLAAGRDARVDAALEAVFGVKALAAPAALQQWLQGLGVPCDPADHGVSDAEARVHAALASARGRNFIGAPA